MTTTSEFPFVAVYTDLTGEASVGIQVTIQPPYTYYGDYGYEGFAYEIVVDYVDVDGVDRQDVHVYSELTFDPPTAREVLDNFEAEYLHEYFPPEF